MAVGKVGAFDLAKDNWELYVDRLEQYFIANDVKPAVKVATLITAIGGEAYELLVNLCTPVKPAEKSYDELVKVMKNHLQPKPSLLAERFKFRQRVQKRDESIAEYVAELKKLSKDCQFSAEGLHENIRDQFVCGLVSEYIRQRLFAEDDVSFDRAFKLAITMEAAEADAALVEDRGRRNEGTAVSMHQISSVRRGQGGYSNKTTRQASAGYNRGSRDGKRGSYHVPGTRDMHVNRVSNEFKDTAKRNCDACGGHHESVTCKFRAYVCRICNKKGHLKRVCPNVHASTALHNIEPDVSVEQGDSNDSDEVNNFSINTNKLQDYSPYTLNVSVQDMVIPMEIDTGSVISCISTECYHRLFTECQLLERDLTLRYYTGEIMEPLGKIKVVVKFKGIEKLLDLYVVNEGKSNLMGRQWLKELGIMLPLANCNKMSERNETFNINNFSSRYCEVFADGLGRFSGGTVGFRLRENAQPIYMRARPLAYALREPVERALDQLQRDGVITPVSTSDWATPIVPVMKKDGTIRICADFKVTLNKQLEIDRFPLPRVEDLLIKLQGGEKFSKIDLSQAYTQFELDESRKYAVINTHKGLFRFNRLIFGLASSPGIFQRKLEELFGDMPGVGVFLDDIIITGNNNRNHLATLHEVFSRLQKYGLRVRKDKCTFFADSVTYLGFVISKQGVHTCPDKIDAIKRVKVPTSVSELRSFLGLVMYYAKFVPNISTRLSPLYNLLRKEVQFCWDDCCQKAFLDIKELLISGEILAHYSPDLPLVLTTDASSVGIGAVISHLTADGERPIAYASRVLNSAEKSYSQIDREALAIVFGVRKFHHYLYGRRFTLRTDHKPLVSIFGDKAGIPVMAASRMQRWAVLLSGYDYDIEYVRSNRNAADALSRLPVGVAKREVTEKTYLNFIQSFLPVTRKEVQGHQAKDRTLRKVSSHILSGWPTTLDDDELRPYWTRRNELYLDMGCVVWGYRLVIPNSLKASLLKELHVSHPGMVKMKSMARSYMWWPGIDADIERTCRECSTCAVESAAPPRASPQPWPYSPVPWSRLHVDFLGPLSGKTFFVMIDSTSKWLEVFEMARTTAGAVIKVLREVFARFGLPKEVVSDNGPPFTSKEYANFMLLNGIKVTYTAAYHPSSNGAAEGAVKLCKRAIKKSLRDRVDLDAALQAYLMAYRNVVHSTTGVSPAMLLQNRNLRSRLDLLRGSRQVEGRVLEAQRKQMEQAGGKDREFRIGDKVWTRNFAGGKRWLEGQVKVKLGSRNYLIETENGPSLKRHVDQLKNRWLHTVPTDSSTALIPDVAASPTALAQNRVAIPLALTPDHASGPTSLSGSNESFIDAEDGAIELDPAESVRPRHLPRPLMLRPRNIIKPPRRFGFESD